LVKCSK